MLYLSCDHVKVIVKCQRSRAESALSHCAKRRWSSSVAVAKSIIEERSGRGGAHNVAAVTMAKAMAVEMPAPKRSAEGWCDDGGDSGGK
eukprot:3973506-Pleurochrysis_carterae.AAC.1